MSVNFIRSCPLFPKVHMRCPVAARLALSVLLSSFWQWVAEGDGALFLGGVEHPWPVNNSNSSLQFVDVECPVELSYSLFMTSFIYFAY